MYDVPFILLAFLLISFFIGMWLDDFFKMHLPIFTVLFVIIGLITGIWATVKRLIK